MKAALTQMNTMWEEKEKNKAVCERLIKEATAHRAELIIFPEMTLTGFTMNPEKYSEYNCQPVKNDQTAVKCRNYQAAHTSHKLSAVKVNKTEKFFQSLSEKYKIAVLFGYIEEREGNYYNMLELIDGREVLMRYAKIHPFSYGEESRHYSGGNRIESACFHDICMSSFICYDLRFPEIFQISSQKNELICVIANWPEERIEHWKVLLQARAIENQCYIIGVNRAGEGGGLYYPISSMAFDPYGKRIDYTEEGTEIFESQSLLQSCGNKSQFVLQSGGIRCIESGAELLYADIKAETVRQYREEFPLKSDRKENLYRELNKNLSGFQESFYLQNRTGVKSYYLQKQSKIKSY